METETQPSYLINTLCSTCYTRGHLYEDRGSLKCAFKWCEGPAVINHKCLCGQPTGYGDLTCFACNAEWQRIAKTNSDKNYRSVVADFIESMS